MNVHERIWKALSHEEPDRVPIFCQSIEPGFIQSYDDEIEINGEPMMMGMDLQVGKELGLDSKWVHTRGHIADPSLMPEIPQDLKEKFADCRFGSDGHVSRFNPEDKGRSGGGSWYVDGILKTPELLRDWISYMKTFEYPETNYYKSLKTIWDDSISKDFLPIPTAGGPEYTSWAAIGLDRFAYMMRKQPQLVEDLFLGWAKVAKELHTRIFEAGMDMVFICDDHCYKDRCMMSNKQFEQFAYPAIKLLADNAHKHGAKFILHSDGYLVEELPLLIRAGVDAVEPLEYEANNRLKPIKEEFGDKISLIGNVAASDVLSYGTVEETIALTKQCILDAAEGGGYVLGPGSDILTTIKPQNILAMVKTARKYGIYPINKSKFL